ncbi:hypothetical protein PVC01_040013200 [Plasmodium vivax]|uniref:(malaria parasite P. vivax) hypothetical protein n=1 Tax=Plasmodium vivax TaxID=5855 RepID=A0A1G4H837_PLAVI|nr:unnamed protein product [Plasmodium vivax]CAI7718463.1 hypothetical protein PVPAM_040020900 [Plasmodium vivax]SCO65607.1 hypothetical protein PVT01_040012600 [Plasmodium vivax]SCO71043.1 hypothetical protein PVC01_040013200 [Plasmodium vivax]
MGFPPVRPNELIKKDTTVQSGNAGQKSAPDCGHTNGGVTIKQLDKLVKGVQSKKEEDHLWLDPLHVLGLQNG